MYIYMYIHNSPDYSYVYTMLNSLLTAAAASESLTLLKALQKSAVMSVDWSQLLLISSMVSALLAA